MHVTRDISDDALQALGVFLGIQSENSGTSFAGLDEIKQQLDGCRLPCSVRPDETKPFALLHSEVNIVQSHTLTVSFGQTFHFDCFHCNPSSKELYIYPLYVFSAEVYSNSMIFLP